MTDVTISSVLGNNGAAEAALAWQMIATNNEAAKAWALADRRQVFDRLIFNLYGVSIDALTRAAAFDDAEDAYALAANAEYAAMAAGDSALLTAAGTSLEMWRHLRPANIGAFTEVSTGERLNVSTKASITEPASIQWHPDGFRFYVFDQSAKNFEEFLTSVRWSTANANVTAVAQFSLSVQDPNAKAAAISADGTHVIMVGSFNRVYLYTLGAPWSVSTMAYAGANFSVPTYTDPVDIAWGPNGNKFFVLYDGTPGRVLVEYTIAVAWDVANASQANVLDVESFAPRPQGFSISQNGKRLLICCFNNDTIYQRYVTTAWSLAAATSVSSLDVSGFDTRPYGVAQSPNGVHVYLLGDTNNTIYHFRSVAGLSVT